MNTILRNLFYTLRRFRMASNLNLLGLSVASTAFILIMMKVGYERSFDTCYPEADRVTMLAFDLDEEYKAFMVLPRGLVDHVIEQTPGVECGSIYARSWFDVSFYLDPENPVYFKEEPYGIYKSFVQTVGMEFVAGSADGMDAPDGMLIPESKAKKLFPDGNAVGSYLYRKGKSVLIDEDQVRFRICGVYKDFPENSQFAANPLLVRMNDYQKGHWTSWNYFAFLRLKPGVTPEEVNRQIAQLGVNERMKNSSGMAVVAYVIPITDLYYNLPENDFFKTGNRQHIYLLITLAFLIILIASVNLINFSTALTPMRIRSINTQKVLGSSVNALRIGLVGESVCIVSLSWLLGLLLVWGLNRTGYLNFLDFTPSLTMYWKPVLVSGLLALLVGVLAGLYPAYYMTSFPPALMLKGNYALSGKGKQLRTLLISLQYVVSFILIVTSYFIYLQNRYMRQHELGVERDRLVMAYLPNVPIDDSMYRSFEQQLKSYPDIEEVAYAGIDLGGRNVYSTYQLDYHDQEIDMFLIPVTPNFCRTMGMEVLAGRDFLPNDSIRSDHLNFIATYDAKEKLNIPVGEVFNFENWDTKATVVGYVNNLQLTSLRNEGQSTFVFIANPVYDGRQLPYAYIRVKAGSDMDVALAHIRESIEENFTGYPVDIRFFDQVYASLYQKETGQQYMVTLLSLLAILISLVGVFGLVIFEAEHRSKEIALRKVYGATISQILWMFNRSYLRLVVVCSAVAAPFAWYVVHEWLESFPHRIAITPWAFLGAFLIIILMTSVVITLQSYRTATRNPIDSIKSE